MQPLRRLLLALALLAGTAPVLAAGTASASGPVDGSSCNQWVRLVDVSAYQPNINWSELKTNGGVAGVYIKATEGNWYTSPTFGSQIAGAASVGLPWGGYDYAQTGVSPTVDAQYFVNAGGAAGTLPPVLDLEQSSLSGEWTAVWALAWANEVYALTGRQTTLYTGAYYPWSNLPQMTAVGSGSLYVASYPLGYTPVPGGSACGLTQPSTGAWPGWSIWQYSSVTPVAGIYSNVDLDVASPAWWAAATGGTVTPPVPGTSRFPAGTYTIGSSGTGVIAIQTLLRSAGLYGGQIDGVYGQGTANAVYSWQVRLGLAPDFVWGPSTQKATNDFIAFLNTLPKPHKPKPKYGSKRFVRVCERKVLVEGSHGQCVKFAQRLLQTHGWPVSADGKFGPSTTTAVNHFKTTKKMRTNGRIGRRTWKALT